MAFDAKQRFLSFVPGANGVIFAIQADGALLWYQHTGWAGGTASWAPASGTTIGTGWHQFTTVLASGDGQLYGLRPDGTMLWYRLNSMNANTGAYSWASNSGAQIGSGFDAYARLIGGWNGVFFAIDFDGNLAYFYYAAGNGSATWANGNGTVIGNGFNLLTKAFADPNGVIYGVLQSASLSWWRYNVTNVNSGAGFWSNGGNGIEVGTDWGEASQTATFSNTSGVIYGVAVNLSVPLGTDNVLEWYRLNNSDAIDSAGVSWYNDGSPANVGTGWTNEPSGALQGYPSALSTAQGGSIGIQVSTTWPTYTASVLRLAPSSTGSPVTVTAAASHTGTLKKLPGGYRSNGCGWSTDFSIATTTSWQSGVYAAQLTSPQGNVHNVMFVLTPSTPTNKIAFVVPTNTYTAYNSWDGHDQYTDGQDGVQRTVTMLRPARDTAISATGIINHTLYSDLLLMNWMTSAGIGYDVYTDLDVDGTGDTWMPEYKAVVLASHPEYWTETARENLNSYLNGAGRVISTGGNAIYEMVSYSSDGTAIIFRDTSGDRNFFTNYGEFESDLLGTDYNAATYLDFYPYQVQNDHAFLNGTGLSVGDTFGADGYNGPASGWEVDWAASGIPGLVVIAQGQNPNGGASMCYTPSNPGTGWVLATGSISFNGAVPVDPAIQTILTNAFAAAVL